MPFKKWYYEAMQALSIIIPVLNERDYLPRLLQSIVKQDYAGKYEVIIVDGGSTDGTEAEALKFLGPIPNLFFFSHQKGTSRQRNYGVTKAKYDNLIFLDGDTQLTEHSLERISCHFASKGDFVAVSILLPYDGIIMDYVFATLAYLYFLIVSRTNPIISGMCIITTKRIHEQIGGFNEQAKYAEDIDYGLRAFRGGYKYYILFDTTIKSSTRRLQQMGRFKLGITWLVWYRKTAKHGVAGQQNRSDYEFGNFKKK